jgi:hypothetical protein
MTEAVLAREQVEELPLVEPPAVLALVLAEFARFPEDLLMGNCPCDAGDGEPKE